MLNTKSIQELIDHYENITFTLYQCHKIHVKRTLYLANAYNIITMIITSFTGTSSISLLFQEYNELQILNIIFSYIIVVLGMAQRVYDPSKKYEQHRRAVDMYLQLHYKIKEYTTFNVINNTEEVIKWTKNINVKLEKYRNAFPYIDDNVYDKVKIKCIEQKQKSKSLAINFDEEEIN